MFLPHTYLNKIFVQNNIIFTDGRGNILLIINQYLYIHQYATLSSLIHATWCMNFYFIYNTIEENANQDIVKFSGRHEAIVKSYVMCS